MPQLIESIKPVTFYEKVEQQHSFVLNILAGWCPDCIEQQENISDFVDALSNKLPVLQLLAQQDKGVYVDQEAEALVEELGGHGYPRTVLVVAGKVLSTDNVEVIDSQDLINLAIKFNALLVA
ncbi:periplasmic thioredoxin of cytochrome c-type biogenesis [Psychromonas sp. B3M02]|uniref:periplasmic thioredoxin of cytochrome c-type biogenesis n=1 Tax=unclassified Psychromonas TaxID=2614957 RepID=UPI000DE86A16|nr:periplasmic thioredoxin of cytochrome c-type biogenesis [Psychromonas sp. B3M02]RBW47261.1 periplasmic thioredoxin of cytochrome c-type biogenesis [Psychromonas sp. B3M02]